MGQVSRQKKHKDIWRHLAFNHNHDKHIVFIETLLSTLTDNQLDEVLIILKEIMPTHMTVTTERPYTVVGSYPEDGGTFVEHADGSDVRHAIADAVHGLSVQNLGDDTSAEELEAFADDLTVIAVFEGHLMDVYWERE